MYLFDWLIDCLIRPNILVSYFICFWWWYDRQWHNKRSSFVVCVLVNRCVERDAIVLVLKRTITCVLVQYLIPTTVLYINTQQITIILGLSISALIIRYICMQNTDHFLVLKSCIVVRSFTIIYILYISIYESKGCLSL